MKLLFCPECQDVRKLHDYTIRCKCEASWGQYVDDLNAEYGGKAIILGFSNKSFASALGQYKVNPHNLFGYMFDAFVIPVNAPTIKEVKSCQHGQRQQG